MTMNDALVGCNVVHDPDAVPMQAADLASRPECQEIGGLVETSTIERLASAEGAGLGGFLNERPYADPAMT